jgi:hypothetical protein
MSNKRHKDNNQLSLALDLPVQAPKIESAKALAPLRKSANVIAFSSRQASVPTFRERVVQDLIKTRVMVAD